MLEKPAFLRMSSVLRLTGGGPAREDHRALVVPELVSFLTPPEAVNITVQALNINGGLIMS